MTEEKKERHEEEIIMKKYEVRTFNVETKTGTSADAQTKWANETNQETFLVKAFDTLEDAIACYNELSVTCRDMGSYYLHEAKVIEVNEYDEDGEWIDGGEWIKNHISSKPVYTVLADGVEIDEFSTLEEAQQYVKRCQEEDKENSLAVNPDETELTCEYEIRDQDGKCVDYFPVIKR